MTNPWLSLLKEEDDQAVVEEAMDSIIHVAVDFQQWAKIRETAHHNRILTMGSCNSNLGNNSNLTLGLLSNHNYKTSKVTPLIPLVHLINVLSTTV